ncbi:MAG TPA: glycosyl hydrolase 108 family protein [Candidatus Angelobacter sp.]|nr:glycosyl hydrolase 108 family protein [Candidatus Angelobacter sp.]
MTGNFDNVLKFLLSDEGGFSNDPRDPGGMTNLGVTKRVWEAFVGHPVDETAMRALTPADVAPLYRQNYWNRVHCDDLPVGVDYAVMDYAVNSGTSRAARTLQRACGVADDGAIGPETIDAVNAADPVTLIDNICDQRLAFLQSLPTFDTFGRGWTARVQRVKTASAQMQQTPEVGVGQSGGG